MTLVFEPGRAQVREYNASTSKFLSAAFIFLFCLWSTLSQSGCGGLPGGKSSPSSADSTQVEPLISVTPSSATVGLGIPQRFVGSVTGTPNTNVTWMLSGAGCARTACGTISADGLYTPPASIPV